MERGSSVVERRTRNRGSPGLEPPLVPFGRLGIFVHFMLTQLYKLVPGYRQWWKGE